eukprot:COSAG01_NODE_1349_length_10618_cov_12.745318_13_plen_43_part_00
MFFITPSIGLRDTPGHRVAAPRQGNRAQLGVGDESERRSLVP